ncbi:MAG: 2-hydroxyacid dehydrogenase [Candidatus Bathyarchaeota archaeon]
MKILVVSNRLAKRLSQRRDLLPEDVQIIVPRKGTEKELVELARDVDIIVSTKLSADVVKEARKLKLLQKTGAGVDAMPFDALPDEVFMANTSGANPVPLAEGAVALVLSLAKRVVQRHSAFLEGRSGPRGIELRGKTVCILGMGSIGTEVAKRLRAFDMKVLGLKRNPNKEFKEKLDLEFLGGPSDLHKFLGMSDIIVVTVPLTPETEGMIGEPELRTMKETAYLVNVARAAIIQEEPLYRALKEGWIAGAALDVWWVPHFWDPLWNPEGLDASKYPFWELPNVITTPHNIGSTDSRSDAALEIIAQNIRRISEGKPPVNQVNKELRY